MTQAKHWIGHIKTSFDGAKFWENPVTLQHFDYIKVQEEIGEGGMQHYQFYFCLKKQKRKSWLLKHIHKDAFYEIKRGSVAEAIDYVSKQDTRVPNGVQFEYGEIPNEQSGKATKRDRSELDNAAIELLDDVKKRKLVKIEDISSDLLLHPTFLKAFSAITANIIGIDREVNVFCIIGPRGCGKSQAYKNNIAPQDRAIFSYEGHGWAINGWANTLILDEYMGQLGIARELRLLEGTAGSLEVKHGFAPALYTNVIICSNKPPTQWHTGGLAKQLQLLNASRAGLDTEDFTATPEQCNALYDRLGIYYGDRGYHRITGHYVEIAQSAIRDVKVLKETQSFLTDWLKQGLEGKLPPGNFKDYKDTWQPSQVPIAKDIPQMQVEDLDTWSGPRTEQGAPLLGGSYPAAAAAAAADP